ncbi:surfeit locus protein 5 subunit 22 of mediator complex-domain-containing protein [Lipomyces chichibuensis]|uniref:surfeit locus protein 5 subunit 22 of mediator complex-domain-containing protein n=1 Tax=Lipomyces chichibuensis TaxID=1546026 RepID=UPI003343F3AB
MSTITPNPIQQSQQRILTINQRINEAANTVVSEYTSIVALAPVSGKDKTTTATETYQIECHATSIVRAIEDLLMVSRSLKESWILGQVASTFQMDDEHA